MKFSDSEHTYLPKNIIWMSLERLLAEHEMWVKLPLKEGNNAL